MLISIVDEVAENTHDIDQNNRIGEQGDYRAETCIINRAALVVHLNTMPESVQF